MTKEMAEEDWKINNDWSVFGKAKEELAKEWGVPTSVLDEMEKRPISQDNLTEEKKEKLANIILNFGKEWDSLKRLSPEEVEGDLKEVL